MQSSITWKTIPFALATCVFSAALIAVADPPRTPPPERGVRGEDEGRPPQGTWGGAAPAPAPNRERVRGEDCRAKFAGA